MRLTAMCLPTDYLDEDVHPTPLANTRPEPGSHAHDRGLWPNALPLQPLKDPLGTAMAAVTLGVDR